MGSSGSEENRIRKLIIRDEVDKIKMGQPCVDCDKIYEPYCMDFDHKNNKKMSISAMIQNRFGLKKIILEIKKCELVCVLCHRKRTHDNLLINKLPDSEISKHGRHSRKYRIRHQKLLEEYKNKPCAICNENFPHYQMEFDHLKDKIECISVMISKRRPIVNIVEEINKCQIICSLCHRRKSVKEFEKKWNNFRIIS